MIWIGELPRGDQRCSVDDLCDDDCGDNRSGRSAAIRRQYIGQTCATLVMERSEQSCESVLRPNRCPRTPCRVPRRRTDIETNLVDVVPVSVCLKLGVLEPSPSHHRSTSPHRCQKLCARRGGAHAAAPAKEAADRLRALPPPKRERLEGAQRNIKAPEAWVTRGLQPKWRWTHDTNMCNTTPLGGSRKDSLAQHATTRDSQRPRQRVLLALPEKRARLGGDGAGRPSSNNSQSKLLKSARLQWCIATPLPVKSFSSNISSRLPLPSGSPPPPCDGMGQKQLRERQTESPPVHELHRPIRLPEYPSASPTGPEAVDIGPNLVGITPSLPAAGGADVANFGLCPVELASNLAEFGPCSVDLGRCWSDVG